MTPRGMDVRIETQPEWRTGRVGLAMRAALARKRERVTT